MPSKKSKRRPAQTAGAPKSEGAGPARPRSPSAEDTDQARSERSQRAVKAERLRQAAMEKDGYFF